jgi:hypothetical protein
MPCKLYRRPIYSWDRHSKPAYEAWCETHGCRSESRPCLKERVQELEAALREIAEWDFGCPQHLEGAAAVEIAQRALQVPDAPSNAG